MLENSTRYIPPSSNGYDQAVTKKGSGFIIPTPTFLGGWDLYNRIGWNQI